MLFTLISLWMWCSRLVTAQGTWIKSPFDPPSMPLAVKSPYVNAWGHFGASPIYETWPAMWNTSAEIRQTLGWSAFMRIDGKSYKLLGGPTPGSSSEDAVQMSLSFTSTRSSYLLQAGPVLVNMTFMTPIEATDVMHQSMPFSYLYFDIESSDGGTHNVQIYSDVSGEWITGDVLLDAQWSINEAVDFVYLQMNLTSPVPFQELDAHPQDATMYYCIRKTNGTTWQIGRDDDIRSRFINGSALLNTAEAGHHGVGSPYFDVLGIALDLGNITSTSEPIAYAIGIVRDPAILYRNRFAQDEGRSAYYWANFSNIHDVIEDVLNHFNDALFAAIAVDNKILNDAGKISGEYTEILSLSARQAMGALEYTLLRDSNGQFNTSDVKVFMKDMGGLGSGGVNAVDVIYASMPVYLYLNPTILGYLLSPLMEYQESGQYLNAFAAQDLGNQFPIASGNPNMHHQQIEHSSSMLIMSLAHAQAIGNSNLLRQHYSLLDSWASYLVNNTLNPGDQTTSLSDQINSVNQTNLALKGIIVIGAMARIAGSTDHSNSQKRYDSIAKQYIQQWKSLASSENFLALNFRSSSSGLIYNLYADKLLQLGLVDSSVYDLQTSFYSQQVGSFSYGIPLDTTNAGHISRSDWMMFAAASASSTSVRNTMISQIHAYASLSGANMSFPILYNAQNGSVMNGENSPAQGAMFAPLALNIPIHEVTSDDTHNGHSISIGTIVGATIGGIASIAIILCILIFVYRCRKRRSRGIFKDASQVDPLELSIPDSFEPERLRPITQSFSRVKGPGSLPRPSSNVDGTRNTFEENNSSSSRQQEWRSAVENLQREIDMLRAERYDTATAPPSYTDNFQVHQ